MSTHGPVVVERNQNSFAQVTDMVVEPHIHENLPSTDMVVGWRVTRKRKFLSPCNILIVTKPNHNQRKSSFFEKCGILRHIMRRPSM